MGVLSVMGFETEPGRLVDHLAASAEGLEHLRRLGLQAMNMQTVAGTDSGTILTSVNYSSNAEHTAGLQKVQGDDKWQEFWGRVSSEGSARQVESSIYQDVDAAFQPAMDRPLGAVLVTQWRAKPGRLMDFMGKVMTSIPHIERLGGSARTMQCLVGRYPMTTLITTAFADLDAYGEYADKVATDQQWQDFWADALSDPTADMVRSALLQNISGD